MIDPLLEQILDDPGSDEARAVYADALAERGDPRGELIHLQLELERTPSGPRRRELIRASDLLIWTHRDAWIPAGLRVRFRRGFIEHAILYEGESAAGLAREPVTSLQLDKGAVARDLPRTVRRLRGHVPPALVTARLDEVEIAHVPKGNEFARVPRLCVRLDVVRREAMERVVELPNLVGLRLHAPIDPPPPLPRLDWLELENVRTVQFGGARRLTVRMATESLVMETMHHPAMQEVEDLHLYSWSTEAYARFLASPYLGGLRRLMLWGSVGRGWAKALAPRLGRIDALDVTRASGDDELAPILERDFDELTIGRALPSLARRIAAGDHGRVAHDMTPGWAAIPLLEHRWPPVFRHLVS